MSAHARPSRTVRARYAIAAAACVALIGAVSQLSPSTATAAGTSPALDPAAVAQAQLVGCQAWVRAHPRSTTAQATRMAQCITDETAIIAALSPAPTTPPPTSSSPTAGPTTPAPTTTQPTTVPPTTAPPTTEPPTQSPTPFPTTPTTMPNGCAAVPHVCGFPDATNTGVPADVALTMSGPLTASIAGHVYENLDINGCVSITAANVTIRNSRITGSCDPLVAIRPFDAEVKGTVLDHLDLNSNATGANAIAFRGYTLRSSHVRTRGDCGRVDGDVTILDSFGEILPGGPDDNPSAPHYDCWQSEGTSRPVVIRHSTMSNPYIQTSSLAVLGSNVIIDGNLLIGSRQVGIYCSTAGRSAGPGYVVTNNRFANNPIGPAVAYCEGTTWSGNVNDATGRPM